jgi:hypothetical protein
MGKANTFIFWFFDFFSLHHIIQSLGCPRRVRDYLSFDLSLLVSFSSFGCRKTSFLLTCLISSFVNFFSWSFFPHFSKFQFYFFNTLELGMCTFSLKVVWLGLSIFLFPPLSPPQLPTCHPLLRHSWCLIMEGETFCGQPQTFRFLFANKQLIYIFFLKSTSTLTKWIITLRI